VWQKDLYSLQLIIETIGVIAEETDTVIGKEETM